ncbi:MAG: esterase-like activity of phytase family protein [Alphaproteobacteria bacterium]|nr:esterase-like activity of phytase family protein [Alphaproteobacteria bacterium]
MKRFIALIFGSLLTCTAQAEPVAVTSRPISSFYRIGFGSTFGPFEWRGGLVLTSDNRHFGGLSGLSLNHSCKDMLAVSDRGHWLKARLAYNGDGALVSISDGEIAPIRNEAGKPYAYKKQSDAEALSPLGKGRYLVAFEQQERVGLFDIGSKGLNAPFKLLRSPKMISEAPKNGEMESIGRLSKGRYGDFNIAISEKYRDSRGDTYGWLWKGSKTIPFTVAQHDDYAITDLAILPDGNVLILERSFSKGSLPGMAIRRFAPSKIEPWGRIEPDLLFEGRVPIYAIDNMEGMAVCTRDGEIRVTIVSDNNFSPPLQSTLLLQFSYRP